MNISRHNVIKLRNVLYHRYVIKSLQQQKPGLYFKDVIIKKIKICVTQYPKMSPNNIWQSVPLQGSISSTYLLVALTPVAPQSVRIQSSRQYLLRF